MCRHKNWTQICSIYAYKYRKNQDSLEHLCTDTILRRIIEAAKDLYGPSQQARKVWVYTWGLGNYRNLEKLSGFDQPKVIWNQFLGWHYLMFLLVPRFREKCFNPLRRWIFLLPQVLEINAQRHVYQLDFACVFIFLSRFLMRFKVVSLKKSL